MKTMNEFKYQHHNWFAELQEPATEERAEIDEFFENEIKPKFGQAAHIGEKNDNQVIYHVSYDDNIPIWNEIYKRVINVGDKCGVKLDWEEIKHCMKFTFIWMPPGGKLIPHTALNLRALSAFNMPLRGKTEISFYNRTEDNQPGEKRTTHRYYNPNFLNVNQFHGVENNTDHERLILKTHLLIVPWDKLVESYVGDKQVQMFDFEVPWKNAWKPQAAK